ncbi:MAG: DUF6178 family protein [Desulfobacterales bacterium]|nr:DUF6178 family protein [Desulfobacterales bacterium]
MTEQHEHPEQKIKEALAAGRARHEIASLPAEKLLDSVLEAPDPRALVRAFHEEDFYFLIHKIGPDDSLPVLALASRAQWEYLLDMEGWHRDRLNLNSVERWLKRLQEADSPRLVRWLLEEKKDLLDLFLFWTVEVRIREHDQDPSDFGEGFSTLDNVYYFRARPPSEPPEVFEDRQKEREEFLPQLLERIAEADHVIYQQELLDAQGLIPAEAEEEAYRLRNVRLAERGFLPPEEAVGIYQRLPPEDLDRRGRKRLLPEEEIVSELPAPRFIGEDLPNESLFARALASIHSVAVLYQLQAEFAGLCNRIISADQAEIREPDALRAVVEKAAGYLSIGLAHLVGEERNSPAVAARRIEAHPLIDLFRVGFGLVMALKWRAQRWKKSSWFEAAAGLPLSFWDEVWMGVLGGLLLPRPQCFDHYRTGVLYREFSSPADVSETEEELGKMIRMDRLLSRIGIDLDGRPPQVLTYKNLLLTLWARDTLDGSASRQRSTLTPALTPEAFSRLHRQLFPGPPPKDVTRPRRIADPVKTAFLAWLARRTGQDAEDLGKEMGGIFEALFSEIESELGAVAVERLDPRYIRLFLLAS